MRALEGVDFACRRGSIHAVLGENGAGKSTLIKIMAGVLRPDAGTIGVDGRAQHFTKPSDAAAAGIVCVFQELSLMPDLTVADNIAIADPPRRFGLIDRGAARMASALARIHRENIDPRALRATCPSADRCFEIAGVSASRRSAHLEVTSALTARDVETIYAVRLNCGRGHRHAFISHRMHEVERALCDRLGPATPHRDLLKGRPITDVIVRMMIGREVSTI